MGRRKKYTTAAALRDAVQEYFDSISRLESVKVEEETAERDEYGHKKKQLVEVLGVNGQPIMERIFYVPPERFGLTQSLGISIDTWDRYRDNAKLTPVVTWAEEVMEGWKNRELLRRENKRTSGLIYEMERNHRRKQNDETGGRSSPMVALTDAQLIALAAQAGEG